MDFVNFASKPEPDGTYSAILNGHLLVQENEKVELSIVQAFGEDALYIEVLQKRTAPDGKVTFSACDEMIFLKPDEELLLHVQEGGVLLISDLDTGSKVACTLHTPTPQLSSGVSEGDEKQI